MVARKLLTLVHGLRAATSAPLPCRRRECACPNAIGNQGINNVSRSLGQSGSFTDAVPGSPGFKRSVTGGVSIFDHVAQFDKGPTGEDLIIYVLPIIERVHS
jgi:hypothetical protein